MADEFILSTQDLLLLEEELPAQTTFAAPDLNIYIRAQINLKKISNGAATTFTIFNREVEADIEGFPLLLTISNAGTRNSEYLPSSTRSSIIIDNRPSSFNVNRRFSDLFEDYSAIEQETIISVAALPLNDNTLQISDFTEVYRGVVTDCRVQNDTCRLSLSTNVIPVRVVTRAIDADTFTAAPARSIGRHLPVIFSDDDEYIEVEPLQVTEMYDDSSENHIDYAYATTFADQYLPGDSSDAIKIYFEDQNRDFIECSFVSDPDTAILEFAPVAAGGSDTGSIADIWEELQELAYKLTDGEGSVLGGHIITGCDWILAGQETDTTASITAKIYSESNGFPLNVLSQDTIELSETSKFTETTYNSVACTRFHFAFPRPVAVPHGGSVFVSFSRPKDPNADFLPFTYDGGAGGLTAYEEYTLLDLDGYRTDFRRQVKTDGRHHLAVYALGMDETQNACATADLKEGLGYSTFTLRMRDQNDVPNLAASRWLCAQQGLRDDSSGTISGVSNGRLDNPLYQARLLLMEWDGTDWLDASFDASKFSGTHTAAFGASSRWEIRTAGATQGRRTVDGLLYDICRNGGSRIVAYGSTGSNYLGLYAHGTADSATYTITDDHAVLKSFEIQGRESVINRIIALYNRTIQTRTQSLLAEGGLNNYLSLMDSAEETVDITGSLVTQSQSNWGTSELSDQTFPLITTSATMLSIIGLMLRRFNQPAWFMEIELPYDQLTSLAPMDVVSLDLTALPNYTGTAYSTQLDSGGDYLDTVQTYEAQIEGIAYNYTRGSPLTKILYLRKKDPADV